MTTRESRWYYFDPHGVARAVAGGLLVLCTAGCTVGGDALPRPSALSESGAPAPQDDEDMIVCGYFGVLNIKDGGDRLVTMIGTERTVRLSIAAGRLSVDVGNDGAPEAELSNHGQTVVAVGPGDTFEIAYTYAPDPVRPYGDVSYIRVCPQ